MPQEKRLTAVSWLNKLKVAGRDLEEARIRNDFLFYLMTSLENGVLEQPFDQTPPNVAFLELKILLVRIILKFAWLYNCTSVHIEKIIGFKYLQPAGTKFDSSKSQNSINRNNNLFEKSPDKGAFLLNQPIPKSGVFCYLAIVNKPNQ